MVWEAQVVVKESSMRSRPCKPPAVSGTRSIGGSRRDRLFALRRRFVVLVDANAIAIKVLGNASAWWSTSHPRQVVVKRRLVKIVDESKRSIMIRLASEDKALEFAAAVSDRGGVDPLMHNVAIPEDKELQEQRQLEEMAALFMTNSEFRTRIQQMHGRLEEIWRV